MSIKKYVGRELTVRIDRPMGSADPEQPEFVYKMNYGYLPASRSLDGTAVEAYVLGVFEPLNSFRGKCIAVIQRKDKKHGKLVVVPDDIHLSDKEIRLLTWFQERFFDSEIWR